MVRGGAGGSSSATSPALPRRHRLNPPVPLGAVVRSVGPGTGPGLPWRAVVDGGIEGGRVLDSRVTGKDLGFFHVRVPPRRGVRGPVEQHLLPGVTDDLPVGILVVAGVEFGVDRDPAVGCVLDVTEIASGFEVPSALCVGTGFGGSQEPGGDSEREGAAQRDCAKTAQSSSPFPGESGFSTAKK